MAETETEVKTLGQKILDNIFLLLAIGVAFPGIFYLAWGCVEIFVFNNAQLSDYLQQSGQGFLLGGK